MQYRIALLIGNEVEVRFAPQQVYYLQLPGWYTNVVPIAPILRIMDV